MSATTCLRCMVVGDGFVGKTTLLMRLCKKEISEHYEPTVFDNHAFSTTYNGHNYEIIFIDSAGQEDYSMIRRQFYESVNVFLICFNVSSTESFSNVKEVWLPDLQKNSNALKVLVGTKSDLRTDPETIDALNTSGDIFVSSSVAKNFAQSHKMKYVECSAKQEENTQELLNTMLELYSKRTSDPQKESLNACYCVNPVLRLVKRALCCRNML